MKKLLPALMMIMSSFIALDSMSQSVYWREGFEGGNISTTNPLTGGGPSNYYATSVNSPGFWYMHNSYRTTGSGCGAPYGLSHIRFLQNATDTPYLVTPIVDFGVNEVHFSRTGTARRISVFVRADTIGNTSPYDAGGGWTRIATSPVTTTVCQDTLFTIPAPFNTTTRRVAIGTSQAANVDIDSIWLVSAVPITTPVNFNGVSANFKEGVVKVLWSNETEVNTLKYEIERSSDGRTFSSVGTVSATNARNYSWLDMLPASGSNYYRVKGVDRDSRVTLSTVVRVNTLKGEMQLLISPNPVENRVLNLQLANFDAGIYKLTLFNTSGQAVFSKNVRNEGSSSSESVVLPSIVSPGVYTLQLSNGAVSQKRTVSIK